MTVPEPGRRPAARASGAPVTRQCAGSDVLSCFQATDYIKTTESFYETEGASAAIAALMAGKWIVLPDSSAGFGQQFTLVALADSIQKNHTKVSAGTTSTLNGVPVVSVIGTDNVVLYVATTGPPYPLEVKGSSAKSGTGLITLTQWNEGKTPTPPPGARTPASFG